MHSSSILRTRPRSHPDRR